jgi:glycosyltransferase involved in cell wall biosynthesis
MFHGLRWTVRLARCSDRSLLRHLVSLAEAAWLKGRLVSLGVSHVHAHFGTNSAEVVMLCHALGGPGYSFTVHGPEEFDKPAALHLREKIEQSRFVVAISSFGRSQLYRWVDRVHWPKIKVVHCGLERAFHDVESVPVTAERRLVCVGRLCEQKGQLLLIEAARLLSERGSQFELVLAGDGELRPAIETAIARFNLSDKVRITGWISSAQVRAELLAARAMVLPSFAEGLPVVIMEAMALRRPVLTTYVAGIPELVEDGRTGWLVPAGSLEALADSMMKCLVMDADQLQVMGDAARERVMQRHDIDTEAAKLARHFRDSVDGLA